MPINPRYSQFESIVDEYDFHNVITSEVIDQLVELDFFNKPGAKSHHHNYEGGLYQHSYEVWCHLKGLTDKGVCKWKRPESPFIIAMLHDLCKCDDYIITNDNRIFMNPDREEGHGDKSVWMIKEKLSLTLTPEEEYCILEHMGAYTDSKYWKTYGNHVRMFPNILYVHLADMVSSQHLIELTI